MRPIVTDVPWSVYVCVSVCPLVITTSCAKTAELIEMPFGLWTRVSSRNHVLGPDPPEQEAIGGGATPGPLWSIGTTQRQ